MRQDNPAEDESSLSATFTPLKQATFAVLWVATVFGNVGGFMRDVASAWLATELSASPFDVAMIQVAAVLPICLFAIPAGALADIFDRRRMLIAVQAMLAAVSGVLLVLIRLHALTLGYLVVLTFLGGVGGALFGPAWQSIVAELVDRSQMNRAVALNSLGVNVSRSIGPALGGVALVAIGAAATYGVDVASDILVIAALLWWRRAASAKKQIPEQFVGALRAGMRYARASPELHRVLVRAGIFFLFASAVWALLPLVARQMLGGSASLYGILLSGVGVGAIFGAVLLPAVKRWAPPDALLLAASLLSAAVMMGLVLFPSRAVAVCLMLLLGVAWIAALTTLNSAAQAILPGWVRGRGLAVYLTVFNGAMAVGSLAWGSIAGAVGIRAGLLIAGLGFAVAAVLVYRLKLPGSDGDLDTPGNWPEPSRSDSLGSDRGPVLIQVEYRIRMEDRAAFLASVNKLSIARRRDGAYAWGVAEHTDDAERIVEWFLVESWAEHMRQHERVTNDDAHLHKEVSAFHFGSEPPVANHFVALGKADD